jgi:hypothetical protein
MSEHPAHVIAELRRAGHICIKEGCTAHPTHEFKIQDIAVQTVERYCDKHAAWLRSLAEQIGMFIISEHPIEVLEFEGPSGLPRCITIHIFDGNRIEARASTTSWSPDSMVKALSDPALPGRG